MADSHAIIGGLTITPPITPEEIADLPERDLVMSAAIHHPHEDRILGGLFIAVASGQPRHPGGVPGPAGHGTEIAVGYRGWSDGGSDGLAAAVQEVVDAFGTTSNGGQRRFDGIMQGEYTGDDEPYVYRIAVVDGRAQVFEPDTLWPAAVDRDGYDPPEARTDAQRALQSLPVAVRLRMLDRVLNVMEFGNLDGEGDPGAEWGPDTSQQLDAAFAGVGVIFTSTTTEED